MSLLIIIDGPRGSGKTTKAMELAGNDPHIFKNYSPFDVHRFTKVPPGKNWVFQEVKKGALHELQMIARHGAYVSERRGHDPEMHIAPELIIVDGLC